MINAKANHKELSLQTTTLWDFPRQNYGDRPHGDNKFNGVTPAFIIWNLLQRYTKRGDLVVDPMCGSGTTIDVCKEQDRKVIGYDIAPCRKDIIKNDARKIPLRDNSVDFVFIDSPYSDNIKYSNDPMCIGWKLYEILTRYLTPIDLICISRHNQTSNTPIWHERTRRFNFYLRGFKYLLIMKK